MLRFVIILASILAFSKVAFATGKPVEKNKVTTETVKSHETTVEDTETDADEIDVDTKKTPSK